MKARIVSIFAIVAAVAVTASGASLTMLPVTNAGLTNSGGVNYNVQGLTDDGAYVIASKNNGTQNYSTIIKVSDGTCTYLGTRVTGGRGIGLWSGGFVTAACAETNTATDPMGLAWGAGLSDYAYLQTVNETNVAPNNAVAIDPSTGDGWIVGAHDSHGNEVYAWKVTAGVVNTSLAYNRNPVSGNGGFNGVSTTGIGVGTDASGPSSKEGAFLADVANNGAPYKINPFPGSAGRSQGNGISNNGAYSTGYFYPAAQTSPNVTDGLHAFRNTVAGNTTVELMPAGGDDLSLVQQSNGFDVSDNGTVVGFSYKGKTFAGEQRTSYDATVWFPGQTQGWLLQDLLAYYGVGLDGFSRLERIVSVSSDGLTFSGRGVLASDGSYRGFVATIPEPASLLLLALGGTALLRRRA